nr:RHS repeat-associated core domain-containing protein [uncultured Chryseobacterium sp.]
MDVNDYYPFGLNHLKSGTAFFGQGSYKNYKYNSKELQETGMYSYGWRDYMPDIGRWNGIDQLAESYLSTSTYAYVANNPVSNADVDGRWFNNDGSIDVSGTANGFVSTRSYAQSYLGQNSQQGGGSAEVIAKMIALGGDWYNTGYGFAGTAKIGLAYDGSYTSLNTDLDDYFNIPTVYLTGKSSGWGNQIQSHFNSFINKWNKPGGVYGAIQRLTSYLANQIDDTNEEFPQITDPGGLARTDFDASTWDKFRPGDKTFILDKGSFIQPASLPGGNGFGDTDNAFAEGVKNLLDLAGLFGNKSDSIWIHATIYEPYPHDTMKYVPYKGYKIESAKLNEAAKSLNEHNYKKGWHYKTYGW